MSRTKGATSFTQVSLNELKKLCGNEAKIPVSRTWLKRLGVLAEDGFSISDDKVAEAKVDLRIVEFE